MCTVVIFWWKLGRMYLFNLVLVHMEDLFLLRQLSILSVRLLKHCQHLRSRLNILLQYG